jgi:hypothetical protein
MPTGYTSDLYDGKQQTFEEFAMQCARAFGALVEMREDPPDAPIPDEFKPSDYRVKALATARADLAGVEAWTLEEAQAASEASYKQALARYAEGLDEAGARRERYEDMLAKVEAWEPPTPDHQGLKDFMAQQLRESIDFDCNTDYYQQPEKLSGADFKAQAVEAAKRQVEYHETELAKERERADQRTAWVRALRGSFGGVLA